MIPWFIMMSKFGWINDYKALIIPSCANAFGIFWMRQYCQNNVPKALMEAARIDGCSEWTIFFHVIAPILKPAYASLGIMNFVNQWNEFTQALLILRKEKYYTLPLLLRSMVSDRGNDYGAIMLASTCAALPRFNSAATQSAAVMRDEPTNRQTKASTTTAKPNMSSVT